MIALPRSLARRFRSVLRHSLADQGPRSEWPPLLCRAGPDGLRLFARRGDVGVGYHLPGACPPAAMAFRSSALAGFEGRADEPVALEVLAPGKGRACWGSGKAPGSAEFDTDVPDDVPGWPALPSEWAPLPPAFLTALGEAARTTAKEGGRYALTRVQLRGQAGQVVATDGRQLLVQSGFAFGWKDDLLVPRVRAFGLPELKPEGDVHLGRGEGQVFVRAGPWLFVLGVDASSRYPDTQAVIPGPGQVTCRLRLDAEDAASLPRVLDGLPGKGDDRSPVTLDLDGGAVLRAKAEGGEAAAEAELTRSAVRGKPLRLCIDRSFLRRAAGLGCRELHFAGPERAVLCRGGRLLYLFMPLDKEGALASCPQAATVTPDAESPPARPLAPRRRSKPVPAPNGRPAADPPANGHPAVAGAPPERPLTLEDLVTQADELRSVLQDASGRLARLTAGLKGQRRKSRAVEAAVQSLRQIRLDG